MTMTDRWVKAKMIKDGVDTKLDARYVDDGRPLSGVRMHSSAKSETEGRNIRKLLAKTSWYKERDPEAAGEEESDGEA